MSIGEHVHNIADDAKGRNGKDKRNTIIAVGTILLVVIAYLTLKSMGGGSSGVGTDGGTVDATPGAAGDESANAFTNELSAQNGILAANFAAVLKQLRKQLRLERRQEHQLEKLRKELPHPGAKHTGHPGHQGPQHHKNPFGGKVDQGPIAPHKPAHPRQLSAQHVTHRHGNWAGVGTHPISK